jgi:ClpP class serine protease
LFMHELWLLDSNTLENIESIISAGHNKPSQTELAEFTASYAVDSETGMPRNMSISGDRAMIKVEGVLTDTPDWFMHYFGPGNTTYSSIRSAIAIAEADPNVKEIDLNVNSPGGQATPEWIATIDAIKNTKKPVTAHVGFISASGAYGLSSAADTIVVQNSMTHIGSIGVVHSVRKKNTGNIVEITSSNAPNKRPDPETESGIANITERIDDIEKIFIDTVADGRGVTAEKVKADFGQGGVMLAEKALKAGMIDVITGSDSNEDNNSNGSTVTSSDIAPKTKAVSSGENKVEVSCMDKATILAQHPGVHAEILAEGREGESKRVKALCILGKASGSMGAAVTAIEDGSDPSDQVVLATFMASSMNKTTKKQRQEETDVNGEIVDGAGDGKDDSGAMDMQDQVAKAMCEEMGIDFEQGGE